jgi:hypothetical protein
MFYLVINLFALQGTCLDVYDEFPYDNDPFRHDDLFFTDSNLEEPFSPPAYDSGKKKRTHSAITQGKDEDVRSTKRQKKDSGDMETDELLKEIDASNDDPAEKKKRKAELLFLKRNYALDQIAYRLSCSKNSLTPILDKHIRSKICKLKSEEALSDEKIGETVGFSRSVISKILRQENAKLNPQPTKKQDNSADMQSMCDQQKMVRMAQYQFQQIQALQHQFLQMQSTINQTMPYVYQMCFQPQKTIPPKSPNEPSNILDVPQQ